LAPLLLSWIVVVDVTLEQARHVREIRSQAFFCGLR